MAAQQEAFSADYERAVLPVRVRQQVRSALCIDSRGLLVTTADDIVHGSHVDHWEGGSITMARADAQSNLAILHDQRSVGLAALPLDEDAALHDNEPVSIVGYRVTESDDHGPRKVQQVVERSTLKRVPLDTGTEWQVEIDLPAEFDGGPILNSQGQVVAIIQRPFGGRGPWQAVPISKVRDLLERVDIVFREPYLSMAIARQPARFTAFVAPLPMHPAPELDLQLVLRMSDGTERTFPMEHANSGRHEVEVIPVPPPENPLSVPVTARFKSGFISGLAEDQLVPGHISEAYLSTTRRLEFGAEPKIYFPHDIPQNLVLSRMDELSIRVGDSVFTVTPSMLTELTVEASTAQVVVPVGYTIIASRDGAEVTRVSGKIDIRGFAKSTTQQYLLPAKIQDAGAAGGGRWLILHLPDARKMAVFDVLDPSNIRYIPSIEKGTLVAAGATKLITFLPDAGVVCRWDLATLEREAVQPLEGPGRVRFLCMGCASEGPVLIGWQVEGARPNSTWSLLDINTFQQTELPPQSVQDRFGGSPKASADGRTYSLSAREGPVIVPEPFQVVPKAKGIPGPNGRYLYGGQAVYTAEGEIVSNIPNGSLFIPAHAGDHFLYLRTWRGTDGNNHYEPVVWLAGRQSPAGLIPTLDPNSMRSSGGPDNLDSDSRVHLLPQFDLVALIPPDNDRVELHPIEWQESEAE